MVLVYTWGVSCHCLRGSESPTVNSGSESPTVNSRSESPTVNSGCRPQQNMNILKAGYIVKGFLQQ